VCCSALRVTGLLVGVVGVLIVAGWLIGGLSGLVIGLLAAAAILVFGLGAGEKLALRAVHARPLTEIQNPALYRVAREVAGSARRPMPRIYLSPLATPTAFAVGHGPRRGGVCLTAGLLRILDERELRGVLAHELSHVYNRDVVVTSLTVTVATLITWVANLAWLLPLADAEDDGGPGPLNSLLFLAVGPIAALAVQAGVSRNREFRADAAAVHLTGDPEGLIRALDKIERGVRQRPAEAERNLLAAGHLMIADPLPRRGMARLFATHPPMAQRIERLLKLKDFPF
jgi:heat shock protein HtpX